MPSLTLVTGGPRSGKTGHLLEAAAARYAGDPFASCLVLVPTARHADQFRRRLVEHVGVAFGLDVTTFHLFARRLVPSAALAPTDVANELLDRVVDNCVRGEGAAARFRPIAGAPGLSQLVAHAVSELLVERVPSEAFRTAAEETDEADLAALAEIVAAYREALAARGWSSPREIVSLAAQRLAAGDDDLPSLVLVDGAQFFTTAEVALLAALSARADVLVTLDSKAGERAAWSLEALRRAVPGATERAMEALSDRESQADTRAYTAADDEAQLREIARSIKARLTESPGLRPSDFAVTFRRVTPHLALARRVFAELELPLDPAAGERLAERPFGAWLLRFLRLGVHGWRSEDLVHSLNTGFARPSTWGLRSLDLERLLRVARKHQLWAGLERLGTMDAAIEAYLEQAARQGAPRDDADEYRAAAAAWRRALESLAPVLDPLAMRTPAEHAGVLDVALFGPDASVRTDVEAYPTLDDEAEAVRRELHSFRAVDEALGADSVTFQAFVGALEARMQRPSTILREAGGVLLAPMHTLHGLRFEHVYVAGLVEGEFPAPPRSVALLDRRRRAALAEAGLALPPEARASEDELWQVATTRAEHVSVWRPRLVGQRPGAASYYFDLVASDPEDIPHAPRAERAASKRELAIALTSEWPHQQRRPEDFEAWDRVVRVAPPVEQRRRSFGHAAAHEGLLAGIDVSRLVASERDWSPSRLESYLTCGFQFFGGYALGLSELEEESTQADAATRGSVMHDILRAAVQPLKERGVALTPETVDETIARMREVGPEIWDRAPEEYAFGRVALWRYERARALDQLADLLRREAEFSAQFGITRVADVEGQFGSTLEGVIPPMRVLGQADRVDAGDGVVEIVDYKTGKPIPRGDVENGKKLQLQVYALAAREQLAGGEDVRLIARYAFLRPPAKEWWLDSALEADRQILEAAAEVAGQVRADIERGRFPVVPTVGECPKWCDLRNLCRVNHFSKAKDWPADAWD